MASVLELYTVAGQVLGGAAGSGVELELASGVQGPAGPAGTFTPAPTPADALKYPRVNAAGDGFEYDGSLSEIADQDDTGTPFRNNSGIWRVIQAVTSVDVDLTASGFELGQSLNPVNGENLVTLSIPDPATARESLGFPSLPTSDGAYALTCTVTAGVPVLSWEVAGTSPPPPPTGTPMGLLLAITR